MSVEELLLGEDAITDLPLLTIVAPCLSCQVKVYCRLPKSTTSLSTVAVQVRVTSSTPPATSAPADTDTDTAGGGTVETRVKHFQ